MTWKPAQVDTLRRLAGERLVAADIAARMEIARPGVTRKAVISACQARGITLHGGDCSWPDAHVAELRKLAASGFSTGQIAKAMQRLRPGVTRNAVISACMRYNVPRAANSGGMPHHTRAANARASAKAKPPRSLPLLPEIPAPEPPPPASTWAPLKGTAPKPLIDHSTGQCRWPVVDERDETLFCCAPQRGDAPYCPTHCRVAYVPPPKRRAAA